MKKLLLTISFFLVISGMKSFAVCSALFSYSVNSLTPPVVMFTDSSTGTSGTVTYLWDFGDGATSTLQSPSHSYASDGIYTVQLHITDLTGCNDSTSAVLSLMPPSPTVSAYFFVDSMNAYNCIAPAVVSYYYYVSANSFAPGDSVFTIDVAYGDGLDTSFTIILHNNTYQGMVTHSYLNSGNYNAQLTITGANQVTNSASSSIVVAAVCGTVSGTAYGDLNGNCTLDLGEELANIPIYVYDGTVMVGWTQTDISGDYSFNLPTGITYTVQIASYGGYTGHFVPSCPASGTITVATVPSVNNNFGVECPPGFDLQGFITGWGFRPGTVRSVCVYAYNQFCNTPNGQIEITLDPLLTPMPDTSLIGYTINGQTVTFPIHSNELMWSFCFPVAVDSFAVIGDSVCIDLNITPVAGDSIPSNNTGTFCFPVRNSFDPNDKYVTPEGVGPQGAVAPGTDLTYTIRFQNTGTAPAINIYILDSLDVNLDAASVELIGNSHPVQYSILAGGILRFNFDNINLDDSVSNEPASHGYVTYRIKMINNIANLAVINNTAGIYFDFNSPVITNTTITTVDQTLLAVAALPVSSLISVYPNPAQDKCFLYFDGNNKRIITLSDVLGKEVYRSSSSSESFTLSTLKLSNGIYTIHVYTDGKPADSYKLMVNH